MVKRCNNIWVAMYSQSGSELAKLIKSTGNKPAVILTNTKQGIRPDLYNPGHTMVIHDKHDNLMDWLRKSYPDPDIRETVTITLHGYLRVLPSDVCTRYNIYNGHPAAIDLYPDLKGMDPQVRTWENRDKYKFVGSVVHKVVPEVDEGEIVKSVHLTNTAQSLDDMFAMLTLTSQSAWHFALKEIMR